MSGINKLFNQKSTRDMTQAEVDADHRMVTQITGMTQGTINSINDKAACIYIMGTLMDDYLEYITDTIRAYHMRPGKFNYALNDLNQATKRWKNAFNTLDIITRDQHITNQGGEAVTNYYEVAKQVLDALFNDKAAQENWNWQQRYYYEAAQRNSETKAMQREIKELKEQNERLAGLLAEHNITIEIK